MIDQILSNTLAKKIVETVQRQCSIFKKDEQMMRRNLYGPYTQRRTVEKNGSPLSQWGLRNYGNKVTISKFWCRYAYICRLGAMLRESVHETTLLLTNGYPVATKLNTTTRWKGADNQLVVCASFISRHIIRVFCWKLWETLRWNMEVWIDFALSYPDPKKRWKFRQNCDLAKKDASAAPPRGFCWPAKNQRKSKEGPICWNVIVTALWIKRFRIPSNVKILLEYISIWPVPTSQAQSREVWKTETLEKLCAMAAECQDHNISQHRKDRPV